MKGERVWRSVSILRSRLATYFRHLPINDQCHVCAIPATLEASCAMISLLQVLSWFQT